MIFCPFPIICTSTGNTAASAAAYAAGLKCVVLIPEAAIALGKLAQALIYGARVIALKGNFDDALHLVREISSNFPYALVNSLNPYRIEGQKTAAFEICDALGDAPDYLFIPAGTSSQVFRISERRYCREATLKTKLILKFGGSSLADAACFRAASAIVNESFTCMIERAV